jgi:hypothetical protein
MVAGNREQEDLRKEPQRPGKELRAQPADDAQNDCIYEEPWPVYGFHSNVVPPFQAIGGPHAEETPRLKAYITLFLRMPVSTNSAKSKMI